MDCIYSQQRAAVTSRLCSSVAAVAEAREERCLCNPIAAVRVVAATAAGAAVRSVPQHARARTSDSGNRALQGGYKYHQYQVVGRHLPTEKDPEPTVYRMKLWASDPVRAKSKFWCVQRRSAAGRGAYQRGSNQPGRLGTLRAPGAKQHSAPGGYDAAFPQLDMRQRATREQAQGDQQQPVFCPAEHLLGQEEHYGSAQRLWQQQRRRHRVSNEAQTWEMLQRGVAQADAVWGLAPVSK
jgi:hypothetical protein